MIDVDALYYKWLLSNLEVTNPATERLCWMLHRNAFRRRVGNDVNRAVNGASLRRTFFNEYSEANISPQLSNDLMSKDCSWLEMLVALSTELDFLYEGGVQERFLELIDNMGLTKVIFVPQGHIGDSRYDEIDQELVDQATCRIDDNHFEANGHGGLFPLFSSSFVDQRGVEIWEQHAAYFRERLEGVITWTSTS